MSLNNILITSGKYFSFDDLANNEITERDIAVGLSNTCRFSGQIEDFYSVAQHAVLVSHLVPEEDAWEGLHHDDSEAVLTDIATPLKRLLPDYRAKEKEVEEDFARRFNIRYPYPPSVKYADLVALKFEKHWLLPREDRDWEIVENIPLLSKGKFKCMTPKQARKAWLNRYYELLEKRNNNDKGIIQEMAQY